MTRRDFGQLAFAATTSTRTTSISTKMAGSVRRNAVPAAAMMVAGPHSTLYRGAFGRRDGKSRIPVTTQSIFAIASMTKAITAVATMQLVERGKLELDAPAEKYLPELENLQVLDGWAADGSPKLRAAASPVLLKQLLTHTSGFAYDTWDAEQLRYSEYLEKSKTPKTRTGVLSFDPGTQWRYGTSMDWAGRIVEAVSGETLEDYFQHEILQPLSMRDTSFNVPAAKFPRRVSVYLRGTDGQLKEQARKQPPPAKSFNGGGGLYSTPEDYIRFMQMILRRGSAPDGKKILRAETVDTMIVNHAGDLSAGKLKSVRPAYSADMDVHPGHTDGFGYGFLINGEPHERGRLAGSLAWAGIDNTFFWIDPKRMLCATVMMQFLPFCDPAAIGVLQDFEHAVYAAFKG